MFKITAVVLENKIYFFYLKVYKNKKWSIPYIWSLNYVQLPSHSPVYSVDNITIPSKCGKGVLRRVPEVFDCWFESGSMPYAQNHYPFENRKEFEDGFPGDFIAEGIDQTRGWYVSCVLFL